MIRPASGREIYFADFPFVAVSQSEGCHKLTVKVETRYLRDFLRAAGVNHGKTVRTGGCSRDHPCGAGKQSADSSGKEFFLEFLKHIQASPDGLTVSQVLEIITRALAGAGIEEPRREARLLTEYACGLSLTEQLTARDTLLSSEKIQSLAMAVRRRMAREPVAYITGTRGFWTLELDVSPATLIPRNDTETLIEYLCDLRRNRNSVRTILDLGTGTGCLLLAALTEYPAATGCGTDLSAEAALLASGNARKNKLDTRCFFVVADWGKSLNGQFDVILSNPPYIPRGDIPGLMPDVSRFEPVSALDGGPDGLSDYQELIPSLLSLLSDEGVAILEAGAGQSSDIIRIAESSGLSLAGIRQDIGGVNRAVAFRKQSGHSRSGILSSVNMPEFS